MISQVLLFRKIIHCKFLVFLLIVFLFFSFFSSVCEFWLIEKIGTYGKQNPDFIIIIIKNQGGPSHYLHPGDSYKEAVTLRFLLQIF